MIQQQKRRLRLIPVEALIPPAGWSVNEQVVETIAESLSREGLREPIVIVPGNHIMHGVHRWAAAKKAGMAEVECVVENKSTSVEEHSAKVLVENLARRHLDADERNTLRIDLLRFREASKKPNEIPDRSRERKSAHLHADKPSVIGAAPALRGRAPSAKGEAIVKVARETAASPKALADAVRRAEKRVERTERKAEVVRQEPAPYLDDRGQRIPAALVERWLLHRQTIEKIGTLVRQVNVELGKLAKEPDSNWTQEVADFRHAWGAVRVRKPFAVCAYCKGQDVEHCKRKHCVGWQTEIEQQTVPRELLP